MKCAIASLGPRFVGDPVDVITGEVYDIATDFLLHPSADRRRRDGAGPRGEAFRFERCYQSTRAGAFDALEQDWGLGRGHRHSLDWRVCIDVDGLVVHGPEEKLRFEHLWEDGTSSRRQGWTLERLDANRLRLRRRDEPVRDFERSGAQANGRLTRVRWASGQELRVNYAIGKQAGRQTMRLDTADHSDGWQLRFRWDDACAGGHLRAVYARGPGLSEFGDKPLVRYGYDVDDGAASSDGRALLQSITDGYGHAMRWAYDGNGQVVRRADRRGYAFVYQYDAEGRCIRAAGEDDVDAVRLHYDPQAHETQVVHEANGARWRYRYGPDGNLLDIEGPEGAVQNFLYSDEGALVQESDPTGALWTVVRDATGAVVGKRDPFGHLHPEHEDVTDFEVDPLAQKTPAGAMAQEQGTLLPERFEVPEAGKLGATLPAELRAALLPAEQAGRGVIVRDAQGLLTSIERDYGGQKYRRRYGYDENGNLRHLIDADGSHYRTERSSWNQLVSSTDPLGHVVRYGHSKRDRMVRVEDALGTLTEYEWDARDKLEAVHRHGKLRERYLRDATGALVEKRVPAGTRLAGAREAAAPAGDADSSANGEAIADDDKASEVWMVAYDRGPLRTLLGRRTNADIDGFGVEQSFTRDARGRIASTVWKDTAAGGDTGGELLLESDHAGRRLVDARKDAARPALGFASVRHRHLGVLLRRTDVQLFEDGPVYRTTYRHLDGAGQTRLGAVPTKVGDVTLVHDPTDQLHRLSIPDAGVLRRDFANGTTEVAQYDPRGFCLAKASTRPCGTTPGGALTASRRFLRSAEGDLVAREDAGTDPSRPQGTTRYRYDAAHRLTGVMRPDGTVDEYAHDAAGNLLQQPGLSEGAVAGASQLQGAVAFDTSKAAIGRGNRLYRANGHRFHFDGRDHIERRESAQGSWRYVRDALGRLRRIEWLATGAEDPQTLWEADYDALGRRTEKRIHRTGADGQRTVDTWRFLWDQDRLIAEVYPRGARQQDARASGETPRSGEVAADTPAFRLYVYPDASALVPMLAIDYADIDAEPTSGKAYALFTDHRGAVERVEGPDGEGVWQANISPYGHAVPLAGQSSFGPRSFHQPFRLVGQYHDVETGLSAHRHRNYCPELGRFLESDPIGLRGGVNLYGWPGCPVNIADPLGLGCDDDPPDNTDGVESEGTPKPTPSNEGDGEGASGLKLTREEAITRAEDAANSERLKVDQLGLSRKRTPACVAAVVDRRTGDVFTAHNLPTIAVADLDDFHPLLRPRVEHMIEQHDAGRGHVSNPGTHAEVLALNDALKARGEVSEADLGEFVQLPMWYRGGGRMVPGQPAPCCGNCGPITQGVDNLSGNAPSQRRNAGGKWEFVDEDE